MKGLILKDIRLCRLPFIIGILIELAIVISTFFFKNIEILNDVTIIFLGMAGIGFLFTIACVNSEVSNSIDRNDSIEILIRSLPVKKSKVIMSKTINPIIIYNIFIIISFIPEIIILKYFNITVKYDYLILYYLIGFAASYIIGVINLYVALLFPKGKITSILRGLNLIIFISFGQIIRIFDLNFSNDVWKISFELFIGCLLVVIFSLFISKEILKRYKIIEV